MSARLSRSADSSFSRTPHSPKSSPSQANLHSTPHRKSTRHVQILSPAVSEVVAAPAAPRPRPAYLSATTLLTEGMLPTPEKTPRKKQIHPGDLSGRVLFKDAAPSASESALMFQSPRKRKAKKHNGFSLEDTENQQPLQIFTDSRDRLPEVDASEDNPFYVTPKEEEIKAEPVKNSSKRRKVSGPTKAKKKQHDPQVQNAINHDEGMVYIL